jgi:hypothetical protein
MLELYVKRWYIKTYESINNTQGGFMDANTIHTITLFMSTAAAIFSIFVLAKTYDIKRSIGANANREVPDDVLDRINFLESELEDSYERQAKMSDKIIDTLYSDYEEKNTLNIENEEKEKKI